MQMRDGTFLRSIFLCFLLEANEVGLPVATWARHSDTKGTLTSQSQSLASLRHPLSTTSTFHSQLDQREICTPAMTHKLECRRARTHTYCMRVNSWTSVINSLSGPMFTAYSLSKPQTCLFLLSQNNKHPLSKDFFLSFSLVFFSYMP